MLEETDEQYLQALGKRISVMRKEKRLTQGQLAEICKMEKANLSRIETGKTNPTVLTLRKIAAELFDSFEDLFPKGQE
jgi:transcriptional regulator with XRE-family HTH domain